MRSNQGWSRDALFLALLWIALSGCEAESPAASGNGVAISAAADPGFDAGIVTVISQAVWGYEYGALDASFRPRFDWVFQSDRRLAGIAVDYAGNWQKDIRAEKPDDQVSPRHLAGITASGNKVIETLESGYVERILGAFPGVVSVEMEGAGGLAAAELLAEGRDAPAVLMIRGISDIPNPKSGMFGDKRDRERWKRYAADCVAAFTAAFLRDAVDVTSRLPQPNTDVLLLTYTEGVFDALLRTLETEPLETEQVSVELQVQARPFDRPLTVAIHRLDDRKNSSELEVSLIRWRPDSVVLVDTALGTGSTSIGHVIAGRLVWPFEGEGTSVKARYVDSIRQSRALVGAAQAIEGTVFESDGSPIILKSSTIAAGDDVPEWDDSNTIRTIDQLNPRTAIVDEETWRVAAHLQGRNDGERAPAFLSIQSVRQTAGSDLHDEHKAAENAATVVAELLRSRWPYSPIAGH